MLRGVEGALCLQGGAGLPWREPLAGSGTTECALELVWSVKRGCLLGELRDSRTWAWGGLELSLLSF